MAYRHPALNKIDNTVGLFSWDPERTLPKDLPTITHTAEHLGFSSLWYPEAYGREAMLNGALLIANSSELVVGSAIASIWARDAVNAKNAARSLDAWSDGRYILGLGVSHQPLVERMRGHNYSKPYSAMSEYLDAMASAKMQAPEGDVEPPVLIAALGNKMLELAAEKADGAVPYLVTPEHTARARQVMGKDAFLVVEQGVALTDDDEDYRERCYDYLVMYTGLPNYQNNLRTLGFGDEDFIRGGSTKLQDGLVPRGVEAIADSINAHMEAGANTVILSVLTHRERGFDVTEWEQLSHLTKR
jgi:probable F420-dependent oxidoreductase